MNTLRDTDKRRARPSVWPVYVAAVVIAAASLFFWLLIGPPGLWAALFGCVTAWGLVELDPWGLWCAAGWTVFFGTTSVYTVGEGVWYGEKSVGITPTALMIAIVMLLVWSLVTRRQLFFPPKAESEE